MLQSKQQKSLSWLQFGVPLPIIPWLKRATHRGIFSPQTFISPIWLLPEIKIS